MTNRLSLRRVVFGVCGLAVLGCRSGSAPPIQSSPDAQLRLPEIIGYAAGAQENGPTYVRRTYFRDGEHITVTLARMEMTDAQYADWSRSSLEFPQAGIASSDGNGFFECAPQEPARCNLLLQLRCGLHVEIRGEGVARKRDAEAIAHALGGPRLAGWCPGAA